MKVQGESKKVWFAAHGAKLYLFCATLMFGVFFLNIFWKFVIFLVLQWPKRKSANLSLKIKSSEKQNYVFKLFLSKSKFFTDWFKELQKIRNIVVGKFASFSSVHEGLCWFNKKDGNQPLLVKTLHKFRISFFFYFLSSLSFWQLVSNLT